MYNFWWINRTTSFFVFSLKFEPHNQYNNLSSQPYRYQKHCMHTSFGISGFCSFEFFRPNTRGRKEAEEIESFFFAVS
jgi:hypothetical protein